MKTDLITKLSDKALWIWRKTENNEPLITDAKYLGHDDYFLFVGSGGRLYLIRWDDVLQIEAPDLESNCKENMGGVEKR